MRCVVQIPVEDTLVINPFFREKLGREALIGNPEVSVKKVTKLSNVCTTKSKREFVLNDFSRHL